jgi:hypothetical protein
MDLVVVADTSMQAPTTAHNELMRSPPSELMHIKTLFAEERNMVLSNPASSSGMDTMMTRLFVCAVFVFAMSATSLSPSSAQNAGGPGGMMGMMGGGCPTMGMMSRGGWGEGRQGRGMMRRQPRMGAMVDGRLAYLKGELDITDAQTAPWEGYASAVKARVDLMKGMHETMTEIMQKGTATDRMDARIAGMGAMLESLKAMKPATEALYAVLSDEQKKVADELIGTDCGAM